MKPIITIPEADLVAILGDNGEHWVQGRWGNDVSACLHGAIRRCQPIPGDAYLIEQVARRQGWGTGWNDARSTTWPMVRERLARIEVTDADLAGTFGPQWAAIVVLVRRTAVLTADEVQRLVAAGAAASAAAWAAAAGAATRAATRDAAWNAAGAAARAAAWNAAGAAARDAAWVAAGAAAWAAAWAAAGALAVRDLIGPHGFTQEHYDLLTGPWRTAIGPVHPDDAEVAQ